MSTIVKLLTRECYQICMNLHTLYIAEALLTSSAHVSIRYTCRSICIMSQKGNICYVGFFHVPHGCFQSALIANLKRARNYGNVINYSLSSTIILYFSTELSLECKGI